MPAKRRGTKALPRVYTPVLPVHAIRPHPDAWAHALQLANGDPRRLVTLSEREVIVVNRQVR